jgi:hypothetical protein
VPYEWNTDDLAKVPTLYLPDIIAPFWVTPFIADLMWSLQEQDYKQVNADQPPLQGGAVNENYPDFVSQMLYQHVQGYIDLLQLPQMTGLIDTLSANAHPTKLL